MWLWMTTKHTKDQARDDDFGYNEMPRLVGKDIGPMVGGATRYQTEISGVKEAVFARKL